MSRSKILPMGLRVEKQREQRQDLIENAFAYMCAHGGELPTMSGLAGLCRVSDATVFNYLGQRDALLSEIAHRRLAALADESTEPGPLRRELRRMNRELESQLRDRPDVWRRVWSAAGSIDPSLGRPGRTDPDESGGMQRLLAAARARDELRQDVDLDTQTGALVATWLGALARECRARPKGEASAHVTVGEIVAEPLDGAAWQRISSAVGLVLDGLRLRNERVRVQSGAAKPASPGQSASW